MSEIAPIQPFDRADAVSEIAPIQPFDRADAVSEITGRPYPGG